MRPFPRWLKVGLILVVAVLIGGGIVIYRALRHRLLQEVNANLEAIAQLKVNQIGDWRTAREIEAAVMMDSPYYIQMISGWKTGARANEEDMLLRFGIAQKHYQTKDVLLVSTAGEIFLRLSHHEGGLHEKTLQALQTAFRIRRPVVSDLYLLPGESQPQLDVVAPYFIQRGDSVIPANAILYRYDVRQYLYPIIRKWPVPSQSAETLLVRREDNSVVFLNDLRHQNIKAFSLQIPLSRTDLPAAMAVAGKRGVVQGRDYRGVDVLAVLKEVPDTPWFLVAKIDKAEALAALRLDSALILGLFAFLTISATTFMGILWQRNEKFHYRAMFEAENAQRITESRYRRTLDGIREGCQIIDFEWRHLYLNATSIRNSGRTEKELLGHPVRETFPGIESTAVFTAFQRCMKERIPQTIDTLIDLPDGSKRWFESSIQPIPEGIFVLSTDITARKIAEESVRESEARYRSLFEHMTEGVFRLSADRELIDINPAALKIMGLAKDEFAVIAKAGLEPNSIREDGSLILEQDHPPIAALRTGAVTSEVIGVLNPKTNDRIWIESDAIPEFREGDSKPYRVLVTLHDITDRKKAEAERSLLASAIEQSGEVIVIIDTNRLVQYVNPAFEAVTGKKREEAIGRTLPQETIGSQDESFFSGFWDTVSSGKVWRGRIVNRKKDGTPYTEEITASPVFNSSGKIVSYVSVSRDITDLLKLQSDKERLQLQFLQAQKMESVGRLAGGVAHDFNNMLSVILGHTQLSLETITDSHPLHMHLEEINKAALRSAELTRQLLAFARKQTVAPKVLDLNDAISGLLNMLRRLIGEGIDLEWLPGSDISPIRIDPAQVSQILTNLTINARDAIDGVGRITIETENVTIDDDYCASHSGFVPGEYVALSASDNGRGMKKDITDHLFEPFFTTKKVGEGSGLGLATVYGIVKQNEGFINVYSEPGKGSTFRIYFPKILDQTVPEKLETNPAPPRGGTETVLLVEDEAALKTLAKIMLERLGYTVLAASIPSEALRLASEYSGEIHLLLVDVVMPEMTGRDLSEKLNSIRPHLKRLYMSGYTANVIAHHGVLDEGVHFVQKPFSAKTLAAKVREALEE